jgi:hypothetical protein
MVQEARMAVYEDLRRGDGGNGGRDAETNSGSLKGDIEMSRANRKSRAQTENVARKINVRCERHR